MDAKTEGFKFTDILYSSMTEVEDLIIEMQAVKTAHPSLEVQDVLKIFEIKSMRELTTQLKRLANVR